MEEKNQHQSQLAEGDRPADLAPWLEASAKNVQLNYGLYMSSLVLGITGIIGVVFAYMNKRGANAILASHYRYQIRTFWIAILYLIISGLLVFVVIGVPLMIATIVWYLVRNVKGLLAISKSQPIDNPTTWWI